MFFLANYSIKISHYNHSEFISLKSLDWLTKIFTGEKTWPPLKNRLYIYGSMASMAVSIPTALLNFSLIQPFNELSTMMIVQISAKS